MPRVPIGNWADTAVSWAQTHLEGLFSAIGYVVGGLVSGLETGLSSPAPWALAASVAFVAWWARGPLFGLLAFAGLALIDAMGQWEAAMATLALVLVASLAAIVVAVPIGIVASRSRSVSMAVKPLLDLMQTMPAFVYLIPAIFFFGIGAVPGVIATMIFAIPPGVRLAELGIRQVDPETVEAARAFGSPPWRTLTRVQLPLALPTIMAGINQVIMLALSMVVIAGVVGAGGLGAVVFQAITRLDVGAGVEGGLAVVVLAMLLDRITSALGLRASSRTARVTAVAHQGTLVSQFLRPRAAFAVSGIAVVALVAGLMGTLAPATPASADNGKTITIGWIPWDEDVAVTHLYKKVLEDKGYDVELVQLDAGPLFSGMAQGDIDLFLDGWLPLTHADYWKKYKADLTDLGTWYDSALPIRDLKDPKGLLGPPEQIHAIGRKGFEKEYPDVAKMLAGFQLDDKSLGSLENLVLNKYDEGQEKKAVTEWLKANPGIMDAK